MAKKRTPTPAKRRNRVYLTLDNQEREALENLANEAQRPVTVYAKILLLRQMAMIDPPPVAARRSRS
jgi:hypothetical protein